MTTRQSAHRARRIAEGARQVSHMLDAETSAALDVLTVRWACSAAEAVRRAVRSAGAEP